MPPVSPHTTPIANVLPAVPALIANECARDVASEQLNLPAESSQAEHSPDVIIAQHSNEFVIPKRTTRQPAANSWSPPAIRTRNSFGTLCDMLPFDNTIDNETDNRNEINNRRRTFTPPPRMQNKRPVITTTEKHLENFIPVVPGKQNFSQATKGPTILVAGDSMIQRIRRKDFFRIIDNGFVRFKSFPGASTAKLNYYIVPELVEQSCDTVLIHAGTNDLADKSEGDIISDFTSVRETCIKYGVKRIIFSGIIRRNLRDNLEFKREVINTRLEALVGGLWSRDERIFSQFIYNDNIGNNDLDQWGLHLGPSGNHLLANNLASSINNR